MNGREEKKKKTHQLVQVKHDWEEEKAAVQWMEHAWLIVCLAARTQQ